MTAEENVLKTMLKPEVRLLGLNASFTSKLAANFTYFESVTLLGYIFVLNTPESVSLKYREHFLE